MENKKRLRNSYRLEETTETRPLNEMWYFGFGLGTEKKIILVGKLKKTEQGL